MDNQPEIQPNKFIKSLNVASENKFFLGFIAGSIILGIITGYLLSNSKTAQSTNIPIAQNPKSPQQDNRTFRDFAEGTIQKRPAPKNESEYVEGTHLLVREGAVSVALTSSVVDLDQYEGKRVKVFGETQKAIKEGWLMDVGKVEVK